MTSAPDLAVPASGLPAPAADAWDMLADRLGADPFVRPGWIESWNAAFGGGPVRALRVHREGRLAGVLPLRGGRLVRAPTNDHTPAFAPLASDNEAHAALAAQLFERSPTAVSIAYLDGAGPALAALLAAAAAAGYAVTVRPIHRSPVLRFEDGPAWEANVSRGVRSDLRRRMRRLEDGGQVTVTFAREETALADLLALERRGWKGAKGTAIVADPALGRFYGQVAAWAAGRGSLRVAALRLDDRPVAALLALEEAGALHLLKAGYDPGLSRYSPGQLLLRATLQRAADEGLERVEFHGADEPYKRAWTRDVRERVNFEAFAPTTAGRLARAGATRGRTLARRALSVRSPLPKRSKR
jgi:CelD/BcsL family acetyltransferase involved in cellulose biosynthesis